MREHWILLKEWKSKNEHLHFCRSFCKMNVCWMIDWYINRSWRNTAMLFTNITFILFIFIFWFTLSLWAISYPLLNKRISSIFPNFVLACLKPDYILHHILSFFLLINSFFLLFPNRADFGNNIVKQLSSRQAKLFALGSCKFFYCSNN